LVDIASKGGNYLLNVGPNSLGEIPAPSVERLHAIGAWMKRNGRAIYATSPSPFKRLPWGRCTRVTGKSGSTLYLHVFDWPRDGKLMVPGLLNEVEGASLMVGGKKLATARSADGVTISIPPTAPDAISSTIVLKVKGDLKITAPVLQQSASGDLTLSPSEADLHGSEISVEGDAKNENIGFWTNPKDWLEWTFRAVRPGKYALSAEMAGYANSKVTVSVGSQKLEVITPATGSYSTYRRVEMGAIEISAAGKVTISVRPVANGWQPVNLRAIKLVPADK